MTEFRKKKLRTSKFGLGLGLTEFGQVAKTLCKQQWESGDEGLESGDRGGSGAMEAAAAAA